MSLDTLKDILAFAGGLGMFIYGMHVMATGMQQAAGNKTKKLLATLTNNRFVGVLVGAAITAIIQSSSATTVMVVGFVNAQIMSLSQAVGIIMGANIGTTITGWIVSMSEWSALLKPDNFAPLLLIVGTAIMLFAKSQRTKETANILIGFGLLFIGLSSMSGAVKPYASSPIFYQAFTVIGSNPLFGILVGAIVTAIIQSSSASMGILQTLALNGVVNWGAAAFIALGQNIGTCVTALISCIGANKNAQRAAIIHLLFNLIGSIVIGAVVWVFFLMNPIIANSTVNSTALAIFHTSFNIATTVILFPFANWLVKLSEMLVSDKGKDEGKVLVHLDNRLLQTPAFALVAVEQEIDKMGSLALDNILYSRDCLVTNKNFEKLHANELKINTYEKEISQFLSSMSADSLTDAEQLELKHAIMAISDVERISDHAQQIANLAQNEIQDKKFSELAIEDINSISNQCYHALKYALEMHSSRDVSLYNKVKKYTDQVEWMEHTMREGHIQRLIDKNCSVESGIVFLDSVNNYRRMADHAKQLAQYVISEENVG
jgi:phosphate:Na+ symporter